MINPFSATTDCHPIALMLLIVALHPYAEMKMLLFAVFVKSQLLPFALAIGRPTSFLPFKNVD
jgi:hypothetical protein